jgi:four helix bundle protein
MAPGQTFENLLVWQKAMDLVVDIYSLCRQGELAKDRDLRDQLQRAAVSIAANIAEGYERVSRKEYIQFLTIAKGSAGELLCLIQIVIHLNLVDNEILKNLAERTIEVSRMLKGAINTLKEGKP